MEQPPMNLLLCRLKTALPSYKRPPRSHFAIIVGMALSTADSITAAGLRHHTAMPASSKQVESHLLSIPSRRVAVIIAAHVVILRILLNLPEYRIILFSNFVFSPSPASGKVTSSVGMLETIITCAALPNDAKNYDDESSNSSSNSTTTTLLNMTALEWIMKSPLGCEFSHVGGRGRVLEQLRNKHILFIGDSVLRYQYRALLYSLHFGHTNVKGPGNITHPSEVWKGNFHSFNRFYQQIQIDLTEEYFQCDCFRRHDTMAGMFENMYYFEPEYNFNLTFIVHTDWITGGHRPLRWKQEFNKSELDVYVSQGSNATAPIVAPDFLTISVPELVNMLIDDVGTVDELVVSLGDHWSMGAVGKESSKWTWEEYARPLERLVKASNTPTYALSTRTHLRAPLTSLATEDNWKIFNRTAIIEPLVELFQKQEWPMGLMYTDNVHFWGWVYDRLNAELLEVLSLKQLP